MMNISQDFAPPFKLVLPYFIIGTVFYFLSTLYLFTINEFTIYNQNILAWTHIFLLGFVMMIIFGAMAQLIPVTLEVGHFSIEFYYLIYPLLLIGTLLMFLGFSYSSSFLPYGGIIVFISMAIFLLESLLTLKKVKKITNVIRTIALSKLFLLIGLIFGLLMAFAYGGYLDIDINKLLKAHVFSLVFGYILLVIMALSLILLPMFGLSHNFSQKPLNMAVFILVVSVFIIIFASLFSLKILESFAYLGTIISLLIYFYQSFLIYKTRARKENDIYVKSLFFSYFSFLISIIIVFIYLFTENDKHLLAAGFLLFSGFFTFMIIGHLYKILPFLVWFEKFSPLVGKQKVPMLADMIPTKEAYYQLYFGMAGVLLASFAIFVSSNILFKAGVSFVFVSAVFLLKNIFYIIRFK